MKKYKYGTPGRVLNYAAPVYDIFMNFFLNNYDKKTAELIYSDITKICKANYLLDIGCGTGSITGILSKKLNNGFCVGIDAAPKMIKIAVKKNYQVKNAAFINTVSENLPFDNKSFDCVINTMFLHHIPYDSKIRTFKEIYRILKHGGVAYTIDFSKPENIAGKLFLKSSAFLLAQNEIAENAKYSLDYFLNITGFKNVSITNLKFGIIYKIIGVKP